MLAASNLVRIWRSLLNYSLTYTNVLRVSNAGLQLDKDKKVLAELFSYIVTVLLKVWWPYATLFAFIFLYTIQ